MSRLISTIKSRNKIKKEVYDRRMDELNRIKRNTTFTAQVTDIMKKIDIILEDDDVDKLVIEVSRDNVAGFSSLIISSSELSEFEVRQVKGSPNKFIIAKKFISL